MTRPLLVSALLIVQLGCPTPSPAPPVAPPAPPVAAALPTAASASTAHDLPAKEVTATSEAYEGAAMALPGFDGSVQDLWLLRPELLCRGQAPRQVIVDVDQTTVRGNFVSRVEVHPQARAALLALDADHGVTYLSANFAVDRIARFLERTGYPQAPLIARPRNYWKPDYSAWCAQGTRYDLCESAFKLDALERLRGRCPRRDLPLVGLGDKFSDYLAYEQAGLCPLIVRDGHVDETNARELAAGCALDRDGRYAWLPDGKGLGERCAVVPERFLVGWDQAEARARAVLSGRVACGAW
jgi:hypothetical protein